MSLLTSILIVIFNTQSCNAGGISPALREHLEKNEVPRCHVNAYSRSTTIPNPIQLLGHGQSKAVRLVEKVFKKKQKEDGNHVFAQWFSMHLEISYKGELTNKFRATQVNAFDHGSKIRKDLQSKADAFAKEHGCLFAELNELPGDA